MAKRDYRISVAGYRFDPLEEPPALPRDLAGDEPTAEPTYHLVQFTKSLDREDRERLRGMGLRLDEYVPRLAYLEKLTPRQLSALSRDPAFRASARFQPAFKIDPKIGGVPARSEDRRRMEGLPLRAVLFPEADPEAVVRGLEEVGASDIRVVDDRALGGALRVLFVLPSTERLPAIARLDQVRWIEEVPEIVEDNVNAAGTIQSGMAGT